MEELIKSSIFNGLVFAIYDKLGPQPVYMFPEPIRRNSQDNANHETQKDLLELTMRDYTHISIKNLSLLIGDGSIFENPKIKEFRHYGVIPFPDFHSTSLTFFHFVEINGQTEQPAATAFSLLIDEDRRSFLYNNMDRLKHLIMEFFQKFDKELLGHIKPQEEIEHHFKSLLKQVMEIEQSPSTSLSAQRKMKILFSGLDDSGKSSFLLSVDRKYSKLIGVKPTLGAKVSSIEALGATIFLWDLGGQLSLRQKYLNKAQIYLYEADLLFYFIDVRNGNRFEESLEYLANIIKVLSNFNQKTPIIYIFSKSDPDILDSNEIQNNIDNLSKCLIQNGQPEIFFTSIFDPFSILRAFSSGIAKLSPNRDLIEHNLSLFSKETKIYLALLMSSDGLIIAESYTSKASKITKINKPQELLSVFELTGPQFAILFKIFSKYRIIPQNEAVFKVANSVILVRKVKISNFDMFLLLLMDDESKKNNINLKLPNFLEITRDLLLTYIS
ncbi:MAG: Rab family GTPase [Promethearchaeota archaeon]